LPPLCCNPRGCPANSYPNVDERSMSVAERIRRGGP
jgi:hypothetical protein